MFKKIFAFFLILTLFIPSITFATDWSFTISLIKRMDHQIKWSVTCTSNGSALSTPVDLVALMSSKQLAAILGSWQMVMDVQPGTGAVIPDTTIDITFTDESGNTIYAETGFAYDANTAGNDLSVDWNQYLPIFKEFNIAFNDIGGAGDQVTLFFTAWVP